MATVTDIGTLLTQTPGIRGGRLRIAGTGGSVRRIAMGNTPDEIPRLTLAQIHAAHANQEQMDAEIITEEAEAYRLEREHTALQKKA